MADATRHIIFAPPPEAFSPHLARWRNALRWRRRKLFILIHTMYLGLGSRYSPWYGYRWGHDVKVLVTDRKGTPPANKYGGGGCWGMKWEDLLQTEWVDKQKRELCAVGVSL